ncbi:MAG TPA: MFS transporter, partial [Aggregatilineales bacterium]|nr:MFS transporter [Aggregatilineales bacterium]
MTPSPQRDLQFTRLYYAAFFGGTAFISPFLYLFFIQQGLNGVQVGWTLSLAATVTLLAAPFWANRNTSWRNPRGALQIFLILTALTLLWLSQQTMFWGI